MVKIKEKRTERLSANVTKSLKETVLEFAENKDDISESKAVEILVKEALIARGLLK
ncbi:MAG: hypothetical protein WAM95_06080 [Bacillus sp. (in: firmicutes)]